MAPDGTAAGTRVLLVEDHDLLAGTLRMALAARGIVATATAGPTASDVLDLARVTQPAVVLLDLDLGPLGSGRDLVRPLAETGAVVVMLTGVTDPLALAACVEQGAVGLLDKTVPFEDLVEAIERVAAGEALLGRARRAELLAALAAQRAAAHDRLGPFTALTHRERQVLAGMVAGRSAGEIAQASFVSVATIRSQIQAVLRKLGVNSQREAVAVARQAGWQPD